MHDGNQGGETRKNYDLRGSHVGGEVYMFCNVYLISYLA